MLSTTTHSAPCGKKTMRNVTRLSFGAALLALLPLVGCGQNLGLGGGAYTESQVTLIVSSTSGGAAAPGGAETAVPTAIAGFGTVKGKVVVDGAAPALAMLLAVGAPTKDAVCAIAGVPNESVVADPAGGLANVFIYLKKAPAGVVIPAFPEGKLNFDQKGCRYSPHAFITRVGQTINITNSDPVAHNVHTMSNNKPLNAALQGGDTKGTDLTYDRSETLPVRAVCDFHAWMDSYHLVVDHPWAAVSAADGSFEIKGVPAGKMEFIVWHEKIGYVERSLKVDVVPDNAVELSLKVPAAKLVAK